MTTIKLISEILKKTDIKEAKMMAAQLKQAGKLTAMEEKMLENTFHNQRQNLIGDTFVKIEENMHDAANKFTGLTKEIRKYNPEELRMLDIQIEEGNSIAQLAGMRNISTSAMRRILELNGRQTLESRILNSVSDEELLKLVQEGKSSKEIAECLGIENAGALTPRLKKLGLNATQTKLKSIPDTYFQQSFRDGISAETLAEQLNVSPQYVHQRYKELGLVRETFSPTPVQIQIVKKLLSDGVSKTEIAKRLVINTKQVTNIVSENNLKTAQEILFDSLPRGKNLQSIMQRSLNWSDLLSELKCDKRMAVKLLQEQGVEFIPPEIPKVKTIEALIQSKPDITINRIAQSLKLSPEVAYKILKKFEFNIGGLCGYRYIPGRYRSTSQREHFLDLIRQGKTPKQISKQMGMPEFAVISEVKDYISNAKFYGYKDVNTFVDYLKTIDNYK